MKALFLLLLAFVVFGTAGFFTWTLFVKPQQDLRVEKTLPPPPPPPDPTLPEFEKVAAVHASGDLLEARTALGDFVERYPESSKIDDAKNLLGDLNTRIFLSSMPAPEKLTYLVKNGDVLDRVARTMKTTSELIVRANGLQANAAGNIILRIGQKLTIPQGDFALRIERRRKNVVVLDHGKFFKQYPIQALPAHLHAAASTKKGPTPKPPKIAGKVTEKIAWANNARVTLADKGYATADHWIVISPSAHSLYSDHDPSEGVTVQKPPGGGYGLAPEHMRELAAMLRKNDPVSIE